MARRFDAPALSDRRLLQVVGTFGPPVRIGESALPPCRLCFQGAPPETVEACRVEPDPHGIEDRLLSRLRGDGETLIAFALVLS